jgi:hypothetical protein
MPSPPRLSSGLGFPYPVVRARKPRSAQVAACRPEGGRGRRLRQARADVHLDSLAAARLDHVQAFEEAR